MKLITLLVPEGYLKMLDQLVEAHFYPNRSEAIRVAIRDLVDSEMWRGATLTGSKAPIILDASSGFREMWTDKNNSIVVFLDQRDDAALSRDFDEYTKQRGRRGHRKWQPANLTVKGDFRRLDFPDGNFKAVIWDPPHLKWLGETSLFKKKYGELNAETWPDDIKRGAKELFRVLEPGGFLFFKWNDNNISIKTVLKLFPYPPLFRNMNSGSGTSKHGKPSHTYWCIFMKPLEGKLDEFSGNRNEQEIIK